MKKHNRMKFAERIIDKAIQNGYTLYVKNPKEVAHVTVTLEMMQSWFTPRPALCLGRDGRQPL